MTFFFVSGKSDEEISYWLDLEDSFATSQAPGYEYSSSLLPEMIKNRSSFVDRGAIFCHPVVQQGSM